MSRMHRAYFKTGQLLQKNGVQRRAFERDRPTPFKDQVSYQFPAIHSISLKSKAKQTTETSSLDATSPPKTLKLGLLNERL